MSRMRWVRSSTLTSRGFARLRWWVGLSSESKRTVWACAASTVSRNSFSLPLPMRVAASGAGRDCRTVASTAAPALAASVYNSSKDSSTVNGGASDDPCASLRGRDFTSRPTRIARSWPAAPGLAVCALLLHCFNGNRRPRHVLRRCRCRGPLSLRGRGVEWLRNHHRRDGVLENQLLLVVRLQHYRVLIETLDPP